MRAYRLQIGGRSHEPRESVILSEDASEDACSLDWITDRQRREWGLYIVADGLSGYHGREASRKAVPIISQQVKKGLQREPDSDCAAIITSAVITANEKLQEQFETYTTLDLALISRQEIYLFHIGDSLTFLIYDGQIKQMTKNESKRGVPTHYLGVQIEAQEIKKRIQHYHFELGKSPKYAFLTTDGLFSRATEQEIEDLLRALPQRNPAAVLDEFKMIIDSPRNLLLSRSVQQIKECYLAGIDDLRLPPQLTKEQLVDWILEKYERQEHEELTRRMDNGMDLGLLKYDDATMILVDLEDHLEQELGRIEDLDTRLQGAMDEIGGLRQSVQGKDLEINAKGERIASLEAVIQSEQEKTRAKQTEIDGLNTTIKDLRAQVEEERQTNGWWESLYYSAVDYLDDRSEALSTELGIGWKESAFFYRQGCAWLEKFIGLEQALAWSKRSVHRYGDIARRIYGQLSQSRSDLESSQAQNILLEARSQAAEKRAAEAEKYITELAKFSGLDSSTTGDDTSTPSAGHVATGSLGDKGTNDSTVQPAGHDGGKTAERAKAEYPIGHIMMKPELKRFEEEQAANKQRG